MDQRQCVVLPSVSLELFIVDEHTKNMLNVILEFFELLFLFQGEVYLMEDNLDVILIDGVNSFFVVRD